MGCLNIHRMVNNHSIRAVAQPAVFSNLARVLT